MIKPFAKRGYWADQMALPWSYTTKPPIGVAMVQVSQVPKWNNGIMPIKRRGNGSGSTKPPSDSVALGRSRGVTMVQTWPQVPKWCIGITSIKRCSDGSGSTKAPKWCCGTRLIKRRDYGSDVTTSPQVMLWLYAYQKVLLWFGHDQSPQVI